MTGADSPGPQMPTKTKTQAQKLRALKRKHKDVGVQALEEECNQVRGGQPLLPQVPTGHVPSSQPPPSPGPKDVPMRCAMGTQKQDGELSQFAAVSRGRLLFFLLFCPSVCLPCSFPVSLSLCAHTHTYTSHTHIHVTHTHTHISTPISTHIHTHTHTHTHFLA